MEAGSTGPGSRGKRQGHSSITIWHQTGETKYKMPSLSYMPWGLASNPFSRCRSGMGMAYAVREKSWMRGNWHRTSFSGIWTQFSSPSLFWCLWFSSSQPLQSSLCLFLLCPNPTPNISFQTGSY